MSKSILLQWYRQKTQESHHFNFFHVTSYECHLVIFLDAPHIFRIRKHHKCVSSLSSYYFYQLDDVEKETISSLSNSFLVSQFKAVYHVRCIPFSSYGFIWMSGTPGIALVMLVKRIYHQPLHNSKEQWSFVHISFKSSSVMSLCFSRHST